MTMQPQQHEHHNNRPTSPISRRTTSPSHPSLSRSSSDPTSPTTTVILQHSTHQPKRPRSSSNSTITAQSKCKNTVMNHYSRKKNILSLLAIIIVFSVITNILVWLQNPLISGQTYQARHYGLGNAGGMDAAWSPIMKQDDKLRRIFREGKLLKRRARGDRRIDGGGRGDATIKNHNDQHRDEDDMNDFTSHPRKQNTTTSSGGRIENPFQMKVDHAMQKRRKELHDLHGQQHQLSQSMTKQGNSTRKKKRRISHDEQRYYQRHLFRPHPFRQKSQSSPWTFTLPAPTESIKLNKLVLLDGNHGVVSDTANEIANLEDWLAGHHGKSNNNATEEDDLAWRSQTVVWENDEDCVPMAEWQTTFHPTCNSLHEMDISLLLHEAAFSLVSSKGHWRNAWKVDVEIAQVNGISLHVNSSHTPKTELPEKQHDDTPTNKYAVLKSLKYIHDPNEEVFELSRVDAVSLDVLTQSPFTINIYGYCGSSSIQEFAGGDLKGLLPKLDPIDKLRMAAWVAEGVAHTHSVDLLGNVGVGQLDAAASDDALVDDSDDKMRNRTDIPIIPLIHNDINMDNVLLGYRQGVELPILNDFNIAVFRKKDVKTGQPCRFRGRFANPQWMSPEQQERSEDELSTGYLNDKIDVYALGNILYKIAVGNSPWKYEYKVSRIAPDMKEKIARAKLRGAKPKVPPEVRNSTNPSIRAVLTAMDRCYRNDAELRPSAMDLTRYLKSELNAVELHANLLDRFDLT